MPKILWMSPYSLHDISSGASIHCKTLLEGLARRGFTVWSTASLIFDMPGGKEVLEPILEKLEGTDQKVFEFDDTGIHYVYTKCKSTSEPEHTLEEQNLFYDVSCEVMDRLKPDFVIAFGTSMSSMTCFAEAKRRGIFTIYPVINGNHGHYAFPHVDLIVTDSKASEKLYRTRDKIRMVPTCEIFSPEKYLVQKHSPKYITLVNPSFEKGLSIFAKMASILKTEMPELKFLVVNSRGNFAENIQYLHTKDKPDEHPFKPSDFTNVDMTPGTRDIRPVYRLTKVLVAPSLWWESWGRVATEAVLNNIPVLTSTSGGLQEASCGAGINLEAPEHCVKDHLSIPTDKEIRPWIDALKRLLNEDWSKQLKAAKAELNVESTLDKFIKVLTPYLEQGESYRVRFGTSEVITPENQGTDYSLKLINHHLNLEQSAKKESEKSAAAASAASAAASAATAASANAAPAEIDDLSVSDNELNGAVGVQGTEAAASVSGDSNISIDSSKVTEIK